MTTSAAEFPCPCCGYLVFNEFGSYEFCDICGWEDDPVQLRWPTLAGGANKPSLLEAQENFRHLGASEERRVRRARTPHEGDSRDPGFRFADPAVDDFEPVNGPRSDWPTDRAVLYWWRPTFWRR